MDGPCGHYATWSKSDRERQILYDLTHIWNVKTNKQTQTNKKRAHRYREQIGACQRWGVGRMGEGDQKVPKKLPVIK